MGITQKTAPTQGLKEEVRVARPPGGSVSSDVGSPIWTSGRKDFRTQVQVTLRACLLTLEMLGTGRPRKGFR